MSTLSADQPETDVPHQGEVRRDFLLLTTGAMAAVGAAYALWPFIDSMNPAADVRAMSSVKVDLGPVMVGQRITVKWRGKPIFICHRTAKEIAMAIADDTVYLLDPEPDSARAKRQEWLIVIGICTHLGCIPLGQKPDGKRGQWGGWFCACHGSVYDTAGRIRKGPAPRNLDLPVYTFLDDTTVRLG